jgi:hypothetical protein
MRRVSARASLVSWSELGLWGWWDPQKSMGKPATQVLNSLAAQPSAVIFTLSARSLDDVRAALAIGPVEVTAFSQDNRRTLGKGTLLLIDTNRARRYIRVGGRRRRCGPSASDHIRTDDRWPHRDYIGSCRGRPCRRQRPIQASTELEGDVDLAQTGRRQAGAGAMSTLV